MVEPHSSNFRVITTNFLGVRKLRIITVIQINFRQVSSSLANIKLSLRQVIWSTQIVWAFLWHCVRFYEDVKFEIDLTFSCQLEVRSENIIRESVSIF